MMSWQLSLKGLLGLIAAIAVWLGIHVAATDRQKRAVKVVIGHGAHVWYENELGMPFYKRSGAGGALDGRSRDGLRGWLATVVGRDHVADVIGVAFPRDAAQTPCLSSVADFINLEELQLVQSKLGDAGLKPLTRLRRLRRLDLSLSDVTDCTLMDLVKLTQIEEVNLCYTSVTDAGLKHLSSLSNMRILILAGRHISDNGLASIAPLRKLEWLDLRGNSSVTDSCISTLQHFRQLTRLCVIQTSITEDGVERLTAALPQCEIAY